MSWRLRRRVDRKSALCAIRREAPDRRLASTPLVAKPPGCEKDIHALGCAPVSTLDSDPRESLVVAGTLRDMGQLVDAQSVLVAGLRLGRDHPEEFRTMVSELVGLYERTHHARRALACLWYLGDTERMHAFERKLQPRELARCAMLHARSKSPSEDEKRTWVVRAAESYERGHWWVHAAEAWREAGKPERALAQWQRGAQRLASQRLLALEGLCRACEVEAARESGAVADAARARAIDLLRWTANSHAERGRGDMAAEVHALLLKLAERWDDQSLLEQASAAIRKHDRWLPPNFETPHPAEELRVWSNGWDVTELVGDWMAHPPAGMSRELVLELRLLALEVDGMPSGAVMYPLSRLAHGLGDGVYPSIRPLELLSRRRAPAVRVAVARALGRLRHRRSLRALTMALDDPSPDVVRAAHRSIASMTEPSMVGGLLSLIGTGTYGRRDHRHAGLERARQAALRAIAGMSEQAQEVVDDILERGSQSDRRILREALGVAATDKHFHVLAQT